ncbi:MAG TPA: glycosyltransferase, partial [Chloroflexota bacterium]
DVVHSPIDASRFAPAQQIGDYYLILARLQPYKRIDLAIGACNRLRVPLHIVGDGPDRSRLQRLAGPTVHFLGRLPDDGVRWELACCRALLWPGEEDFGLAPLEAQASGRPVIAFRAGGALETIVDGTTGVFFAEPTVESLTGALDQFEDNFDPEILRQHALSFDKTAFKKRMFELLDRRYLEHRRRLRDIPAGDSGHAG